MPVTQVAVVQHCATTNVEANLQTLEMLSRAAAAAGADIVTWAEAFAYLGSHAGKQEILERLPEGGPILERCQRLADSLGIELLLGGFHEAVSDDPTKCYNTSVYLSASGEIAAMYRKIHLFDVDIENGPTLMESRQTRAGDSTVLANTQFGLLGVTVCYDVRFPGLYQSLVDQGAIALAVPSAFTATTGAMHWHTLLRARAIENQAYVIAPAQHGQHSKNRESYGHSLIVDPWGQVIAEVASGDGYAIAPIDPGLVAKVRQEIPSLANRRSFS